MIRPTFLLCLLPLMAACDSGRSEPLRLPTEHSVSPPVLAPVPAPVPVVPRGISVGEEVTDTFLGTELAFELTAPRDGTLVATVNWDVWYNGTLLVLVLQGTEFKPVPPHWSPVSGNLQVVAGQTYRLAIKPGGSDWFYNDRFVLVTAIE